MIQDIAPHVFHNEYKNVTPQPEDSVVVLNSKNLLLVKPHGEAVKYPTFAELEGLADVDEATDSAIYLFSVDDQKFFLVNGLTEYPEGYDFSDIHRLYSGEHGWITLVAATAIHLNAWYRDTQYCGRCGAKMEHHHALRAMKCECGNLQFPRIAPVVLAGIIKDDKIVATRYKDRPYKGLALNAGFVEIGESLEQALIREVEEEVGLKVAKLHYYGSQPWGHTGIEMAGFFVEIEGDDTITLDEDELSEAFWCSREELPEQEFDVSLTATMFEAFRKKEFYLFER